MEKTNNPVAVEDHISEYLEKYRYDNAMTSHRIAKRILEFQKNILPVAVEERLQLDLQKIRSDIKTDEEIKLMADDFADGRERRGCAYWSGLRNGFIGGYQSAFKVVPKEHLPVVEDGKERSAFEAGAKMNNYDTAWDIEWTYPTFEHYKNSLPLEESLKEEGNWNYIKEEMEQIVWFESCEKYEESDARFNTLKKQFSIKKL